MENYLETKKILNVLRNEDKEKDQAQKRLAKVETSLKKLKKEAYAETDVKKKLLIKILIHRLQSELDYLQDKIENIQSFIKITMN